MQGFLVKYNGPVPRHIRREITKILRGSWHELGGLWHSRMRPKHFTKAGAKEYGYAPRSGEGKTGKAFWSSYTGRKQRIKHHQDPLVWSGKTKNATATPDVRATSKGVRIVLHAPTLNRRPRNSRVDMAREMRTISRAERALLARQMQGYLNQRILAVGGRTTVRVRSM